MSYRPQVKQPNGQMVDIPLDAETVKGNDVSAKINNIISGAQVVGNATNAANDAQGRDIALTYATKSEIPEDVTINLNGQDVTDPAFYAPTAAGQAGQVLVSNGAGQAPTWQDAGKDISGAVVTLGPALTYNGSEQTQTVQSVVLDDIPLVEGIDYYISGNKQTNAGTYMLSVMGKSSYSGTATKEWTIAKAAAPAISVDKQSVSIVGPAGTTATVTVSASVSGAVSAKTSAPNIVTTTVAGMVVTLTGQSSGSTTVTITFDAGQNYEVATTAIQVSIQLVSSVLSENSWSVIANFAELGQADTVWNIGDEKQIQLSTGENITVLIYGFNHDDLADGSGKAGITFGLKNALDTNYRMNSIQSNSGLWTDKELGKKMSVFKGQLPSELQPLIKTVVKKTSAGNTSTSINETNDDLFLFSLVEIMGTNYLSTSTILSAEGEGEQYAIFKNAVIPSPVSGGPFFALTGNQGTFYGKEGGDYINKFGQKKDLGDGAYCNYENAKGLGENSNSATAWWTRSPDVTNGSQYCEIAPSGQGNRIIATSIRTGVVFGFCL